MDADDDRSQDGDAAALLDGLPEGYSEVLFEGRRWGVTVSSQVGGASRKVFGEELGGTDIVSANLYTTSSGTVLRPCEMSADKVVDFLRAASPAPARPEPTYLTALDLPGWVPDRMANAATRLVWGLRDR